VRRRGVEFDSGEHLKAHVTLVEVFHNLNQVAQTAPEAVELPRHEHVPRSQRPEHLGEGRAILAFARGVLLVNVETARRAEGVPLKVEGLVIGGDTGIAAPRHSTRPFIH
jgi:hypothetical protein